MRYLLDTNVIAEILRGNHEVILRLKLHEPQDCAISSVVAAELYYGALRSKQVERNLEAIDSLPFRVLSFSYDDAVHAAQIREQLASRGTPIGPYDCLIAAQARARNLVLVTHNLREFSRVDGLLLEDWQKEFS